MSVSHRSLVVPEGGSASAYVDTFYATKISKVAGSDPDINVVENLLAYPGYANRGLTRRITFTAGPDTDEQNGTAQFLISDSGSSRVIRVSELDTGVNIPADDPNTVLVPVMVDG